MIFHWNDEKNQILKRERGVSFEQIVVAIEDGALLDIIEHHNRDKYGNQFILVVELEGYAWCVPCVETADGGFFLKTLFASRKYTRLYNLEGLNDR